MKITRVHGREILDSRGNPTVEVDMIVEGGAGRAAVPSGASTGEREALELRDGDPLRYGGKGVRKAVANVNGEIATTIVGREFDTQRALDDALIALDGTPTKSRLGANALLGVSMAAARADAAARGIPLYRHLGALYGVEQFTLPTPMMNILNGGAHADTSVDFQEFMVMPVGAASFDEALRTGAEIFHALRGILKARGQSTGVGDEGGFAPNLKSNRDAIEVVLEAVGKAGMKAGQNVFIALDVAASELWAGGGAYTFKKSGEPGRTSEQMVRLYEEWLRDYPIISIEDGLGGERLGRLADADPRARRPRAARGRRCVRHQSRDPEARHRGPRGQRAAREAQSDRHRHRNARRGEDGARRQVRDDHLASLRRNRGHHDCGPRRRNGGRSNQDRVGEPHGSGRASTTSCCASKKSSGARARFAGRSGIRTQIA